MVACLRAPHVAGAMKDVIQLLGVGGTVFGVFPLSWPAFHSKRYLLLLLKLCYIIIVCSLRLESINHRPSTALVHQLYHYSAIGTGSYQEETAVWSQPRTGTQIATLQHSDNISLGPRPLQPSHPKPHLSHFRILLTNQPSKLAHSQIILYSTQPRLQQPLSLIQQRRQLIHKHLDPDFRHQLTPRVRSRASAARLLLQRRREGRVGKRFCR